MNAKLYVPETLASSINTKRGIPNNNTKNKPNAQLYLKKRVHKLRNKPSSISIVTAYFIPITILQSYRLINSRISSAE